MSRYDFTTILEWDRIEGWFNLPQAVTLQTIVKQLPPRAKVVELGSYKGRSSVAIAAVLPAESILYCVDHFQGSEEHIISHFDVSNLLAEFTQNIEKFGVKDKISTLVMTTSEAATKFDSESVDLVFLDASHDYDSVRADLLNWYPKIKPGGFLLCDDYEVGWSGVMRAIKTVGLAGTVIAESLWMHQKPKPSC
ncbi:class I SAM-dependent methyltransferase [Floridanema evergladense]|uniref:Class I SAM-dependent methyltransferase n=1 Tax=Floridaenema evergladense BLCC-F167 TaxID=3153639 RepID=A0ABV4WI15_9CYAN